FFRKLATRATIIGSLRNSPARKLFVTADPEPDNPFVSPALIEADPQPAFRRLAARLEVDRAVAYGVLVRLWQVLAGPVTLVLIAHHFTPELQGFYYTFGSILALQSFLELGFYVVILNV